MSGTRDPANSYDEYYYQHHCGEPYERNETWLRHFGYIASKIVKHAQPRTVLDAGCAKGLLVEQLRQLGVEAYGIDISPHAISCVHESVKPYCRVASISDPLPGNYDLIVCIEVLEHLPKLESERALSNLCAHTEMILFSSSPVDYREVSHFNVHGPEYWGQLLAENGFLHDLDFDASCVTAWAGMYSRASTSVPLLVNRYERHLWPLWRETQELRSLCAEKHNRLVELEWELKEKQAEPQTSGSRLPQEQSEPGAAWQEELHRLEQQVTCAERYLAEAQLQLSRKDVALRKLNQDLLEQERSIAALESKVHELDNLAVGLRDEVDQQASVFKGVAGSAAWKLVNILARTRRLLIPDGTLRHRMLDKVILALRAVRK